MLIAEIRGWRLKIRLKNAEKKINNLSANYQ